MCKSYIVFRIKLFFLQIVILTYLRNYIFKFKVYENFLHRPQLFRPREGVK